MLFLCSTTIGLIVSLLGKRLALESLNEFAEAEMKRRRKENVERLEELVMTRSDFFSKLDSSFNDEFEHAMRRLFPREYQALYMRDRSKNIIQPFVTYTFLIIT